MLKISVLTTLLTFSLLIVVYAQPTGTIRLSDAHPHAGDSILLTYNAARGPFKNKEQLSATVFFLDNKKFPAAELNLKRNKNSFRSSFIIPQGTMAFFVKINSTDTIDSNNGKGFIYLIYDHYGRPVQGAYASAAYIVSSGKAKQIAGIMTDEARGMAFYQAEISTYPETSGMAQFDRLTDNYAMMLLKKGNFNEAARILKAIYNRSNNNLSITEHYVQALTAAKRYNDAFEVISISLTKGKTSDFLEKELRDVYVRVKGTQAGYAEYLRLLDTSSVNGQRSELKQQMINEPAPLFTLKDMKGNPVSLSDLKGKIVVLDFWATWCGPCISSMPGMQMMVDKYKDSPDVKFLFIDSWETAKDYEALVAKFISDHHYNLKVLMDEKGADNRQSLVLSKYKIQSIPTKFVIDKYGNIRFRYTGYTGSSESLMKEIIMMIDLVTGFEN